MPRATPRDLPDLSHLAQPDAEITARVTPRARRNSVSLSQGVLSVTVTAVPEAGKANDAVRSLLAAALGIAPSRLILKRGGTARVKTFVVR